jgi:nitrogen regulatory protein P-II 1
MGNSYSVEPPRVKVELLVDDSDVERIVHIIAMRAHTGAVGDGAISVMQVDSVTSVAEAYWGKAAS